MNLAKFDQNSKFMIYGWRNSKPIVQMDSYHRHASFSCAAYFDLKHCCIDFNGSRWSIYLKERVSTTSPTWVASPPPRKRPIWLFLPDEVQHCSRNRVMRQQKEIKKMWQHCFIYLFWASNNISNLESIFCVLVAQSIIYIRYFFQKKLRPWNAVSEFFQ
jgi:hypothetical protein